MREFGLNFLKKQRGNIEFLIFIPFLFLAAGSLLSVTESVSASDVDVTRALEAATNAACYSVLEPSVADTNPLTGKTPVINGDEGYLYFADILQKNLGLDSFFNPYTGSFLSSRPEFVVLIYNGTNPYGAPICRKYSYASGVLSSYDVASSGTFPQIISVSSLDVNPGGGGLKNYTLQTPGAVAVIRAPLKQIQSTKNLTVERSICEKIETY